MAPPCVPGHGVSQVAAYQHHKAQLQALAASAVDKAEALRAFTVKLCDFGAALVNTGGPGAPAVGITPRGTSRFCSPQVMSGLLNRGIAPGLTTLWAPAVHPDIVRTCAASYDAYAADVWSFGITLFALASGKEPFLAAGPQCEAFRAFVRATQPETLQDEVLCPLSDVWQRDEAMAEPLEWAWPATFSPALVHLLSGCLRVRQEERLSMEEVVAHAWFRDPAWVPLPVVEAGVSSLLLERCDSISALAATASPGATVCKWHLGQGGGTAAGRGGAAAAGGITPVPPSRLKRFAPGSDGEFVAQPGCAQLDQVGVGGEGGFGGDTGGVNCDHMRFFRGRKLVPALLQQGHGGGASGSSETGPGMLLGQCTRRSVEQDPLGTGCTSLDAPDERRAHTVARAAREQSESHDIVLQ